MARAEDAISQLDLAGNDRWQQNDCDPWQPDMAHRTAMVYMGLRE